MTISERILGEWQPLSSRLDETGHLMTRLVGMNVTQFTQVAMLPQGRFQAFLRARSEERHRLLQQLFRTGRFEEVERWLRDRRQSLRKESETAHQRVADLVSRVSEATVVQLPDDWDVRDLRAPAASGGLLVWASELGTTAHEALRSAEGQALACVDSEAQARAELDHARALRQRRARLDAALAERAELELEAAAHAVAREALAQARSAAGVAPLLKLASAAQEARTLAGRVAEQATERASGELGLLMVDDTVLHDAVEHAANDAARVRAALPRATRLRALTREIAAAQRRHRSASEQITAVTADRAALPDHIAALRAELAVAREALHQRGAVEGLLHELGGRLAAHAQVLTLQGELATAESALAVAASEATSLREAWLDLREARLEGMAAEIAAALVVGASCPVCGSAEHPHKASPTPGSPDAAAEKAALKQLDDAKAAQHLHDQLVRDLTTTLAITREAAGPDAPETLRLDLDQTRGRLAELDSRAARLPELELGLAEAETRRDQLVLEASALLAEVRALESSLHDQQRELARVRTEVDALLDGARDLPAQLELHLARVAVGRAAIQARSEGAAAEQTLSETRAALAAAVEEAGFTTTEQAKAALLSPAVATDLEERIARHERRLAAVAAVLDEPGALELAGLDLPDLESLAAQHRDALAALGEARSRVSLWSTRVGRLAALLTELTEALDDWAPLRESLDLASRMASFVDGKSPDNRLQMRLSAYVLAYRLTQVVAAANERLSRMSDQRYSLEHTGRRGAGETRGGLSLLVRDDWSGESRDPATLSGGETFVVSLALALGLADVITQEAGGADLDTLFVDEGFGSLDADTLDDVMDTLDSLRDGGRVVGVVSHVAEMRDRIPTQLQVVKSRHGSALAVTR